MKMNKQRIVILMVGILLFAGGLAKATIDNFYSDVTILNGDVYDRINIYDTPPDQTIITMMGGTVNTFSTYNSSSLIFSNGHIGYVSLYDSSAFHISGGNIGYIAMYDLETTVHIFGYNFEYTPNTGDPSGRLTGFWADGSAFSIDFRRIPEHLPSSRVVLHEIPEPCLFALFGFGMLIIKRTVETSRK